MEKRTRHRMDCWRIPADHFSGHHLVMENTYQSMTDKGHCFVNLHSTFSHDATASSFF
jgi:hypothetical protein